MNFLVDAQLPPLLSQWINEQTKHTARHVSVLPDGLTTSDADIWHVALENEEAIVTKDFDFFDRAIISEISPKILHIAFGNCTNKQLITFFDKNWNVIAEIFNKDYRLISCSSNYIDYW